MCLGRGWMNQAAVHFERASVLAPNNNEYRQEAIKINQMKLGQKSDFPIVPIIMGTICVESVVCLYGASYCINDICW